MFESYWYLILSERGLKDSHLNLRISPILLIVSEWLKQLPFEREVSCFEFYYSILNF